MLRADMQSLLVLLQTCCEEYWQYNSPGMTVRTRRMVLDLVYIGCPRWESTVADLHLLLLLEVVL